jgi:hypothetical protein
MTKILTTYPDEYIEHWGNVFLANPIVRRRGVLFTAFLVAPEEILAAVAMPLLVDLDEPLPLMPAQRKVQHRQDWVELARTGRTEPHQIAWLHMFSTAKEPSCTSQ